MCPSNQPASQPTNRPASQPTNTCRSTPSRLLLPLVILHTRTFIQEKVCPPNPAWNYSGCASACTTNTSIGSPARCITCTVEWSYGKWSTDGFEECGDELETIREACNATRGRVSTPVIRTKAGLVQGFVDPDQVHATFRGLPFAQPPVGDLRWRPPQPVKPWSGVLNTSVYGPTCKQLGPMWDTIGGVMNSSEDCLFLNVYVPANHLHTAVASGVRAGGRGRRPTLPPPPKLPVMVYFPAGQFMWGSGDDAENFNAPQTAAGAEVIVVTMNYRLGAAGYLALDELKARDPAGSVGNYGTLDQRAVLQWIRENIAAFGGDPSNTVLWGESAGAAAVTAHLVMSKSWPFFDKAIIESGAFNGWSYKTYADATANGKALASHLGCTYNSSTPSLWGGGGEHANQNETKINVSCLLSVDIQTLVLMDDDAERAGSPKYAMPFADRIDKSLWAPVIDGVELVGIPAELLKQGRLAAVPILFGTNRDEGSTFTYNQSGYGDGNLPINGALPDLEGMYSQTLFSYQQCRQQSRQGQCGRAGKPESFSTGLFTHASELESWVRAVFGAKASVVVDALMRLYRPVCTGGPNGTCGNKVPPGPTFDAHGISSWWWSLSRLIGDWVLSCPARRAARRLLAAPNSSNPVFLYHFNHTPTFSLNQGQTEEYGAFHGAEVPFVFYDTVELVEKSERALAEAMVQYWVGFAYHGDPNIPPPAMVGGVDGLPRFPQYTRTEDSTMIFGDTPDGHTGFANVSIYKALKEMECDYWDSLVEQVGGERSSEKILSKHGYS